MKKGSVFLFSLFLVILFFGHVYAGPEDVTLLPLSRWNYYNVDGYGFYDKCGSSSWFVFILHNETSESFTVSVPDTARITGWNGTVHPLANHRYKVLNFGSNHFMVEVPTTAFERELTLPARSTYAVYVDVMNIEAYNLYWDTNVFFTVRISGGGKTADINISGVLAQRGNACPADQVCSAEVTSANYVSDGSGSVIVLIKNDMPDTAEVSALTDVGLSWTDTNGEVQTRTVENGVRWNSKPGWIGSGSQKTVSGVLSLPIEITAVQHELTMTFNFHHPSSFWFGDFSAQTQLTVSGGLQGAMDGSFDTDGSGGRFTAILNNYQPHDVTVTLPEQGILKASDGKTSPVSFAWDQNSPVSIGAYGRADLSGSFVFSDTALIHNNPSLVLSAELTAGNEKGNAAGTVTRNPDPDPKLVSAGFCRDYTPGGQTLSIVYALRNDAHIDIPVQLAGTLAVDDQPKNLAIRYTGCESGGRSCMDRISGTNFIIEPGETAVFHAEVTLEKVLENDGASVRTSLLYTPDGITKALYVGQTSVSCAAPIPEVPTGTPVHTAAAAPTATSTPTGTAAASPTAAIIPGTATATAAAVPTTAPSMTPTSLPTETPTEIPTSAPSITPTAVPTETPTEIPLPTSIPGEALLEMTVSGGSYSSCSSDISLRFMMVIRNTGTIPGDIRPDQIRFSMDEKKIPVGFSSCTMMTAGGTDNCSGMLQSGKLTVNPGTSIRLDAVYVPGSPIRKDSVQMSAESEMLIPERVEFTAYSAGSECEPLIEAETVPDNGGTAISGTVSSGEDHIDLILRLVNSGTADAEITPGTIYLHHSSVEEYQGIGNIRPIVFEDVIKDVFMFTKGESFTLPARSAADLELELQDLPAGITSGRTEITWNFSIGNETRNFTGYAALSPEQTSERPGLSPDKDTNSSSPADTFESILPEGPLPATGFPARGDTGHRSVRSADPAYQSLDGLLLEIPSLETSAEILMVPLDENGEWEVSRLEDRAGILEDTPLPGQGTSVIAAHNHLDEMRTGPFYALNQMEPNDRVFISDRSGEMLIFRVYRNTLVTPEDSGVISGKAIPGSLILLTCESELPEGGYAYRRLVFAEPLQ